MKFLTAFQDDEYHCGYFEGEEVRKISAEKIKWIRVLLGVVGVKPEDSPATDYLEEGGFEEDATLLRIVKQQDVTPITFVGKVGSSIKLITEDGTLWEAYVDAVEVEPQNETNTIHGVFVSSPAIVVRYKLVRVLIPDISTNIPNHPRTA